MDPKKVGFLEQLLSARRKVVSGFGLGVGASLIVLTLLLSLESPLGKSLFPVSNDVNSVNPLFSLWPFSFSSTSNSSKSSSVVERMERASVLYKNQKGHSSGISRKENFKDTEGEVKIVSFSTRENASNWSKIAEDRQKLGNLSEVTEFSKGKLDVERKSVYNSSNLKNEKTENQDLHNLAYSDAPVGAAGEDKANHRENSGETNKTADGSQSNEECDIFDGRWVKDDSKPYYPAGSCPYIDRDFDCHLNRRPDNGYVKWKWQPNGCHIPSLNATDFLERLRGRRLVFVGDSLNRNMWESLVCILRQSIQSKKRVYEISGRREFKKKGFYAFRFEDYNCSVDFVSSPFLVRESYLDAKTGSFETLRLDLMDQSTSMYHDADLIVFNTGHWWTHGKTSRGEDYYQEGDYVHPRLKVLEAYKRALTTWARWIDNNIDLNKTIIFFRGYSVTHFRGGQWNSGGQCHKETEPIFNRSHLSKYPSKMRALQHVLQEMKTPVVYLNISRLTDYRKDGHPSIYRTEYSTVEETIAAERSQDCSHWCLPGVPDTWNELLYASILKVTRGFW